MGALAGYCIKATVFLYSCGVLITMLSWLMLMGIVKRTRAALCQLGVSKAARKRTQMQTTGQTGTVW